MGNYIEHILSEEQMAAYLDGMLSTEESYMMEATISSSPELTELQEIVDSVDTAYIEDLNCEIPIECMADDFTLPDIDYVTDYEEDSTMDDDDVAMHEDSCDDVNGCIDDTECFDDFEL